ncbi:hypothetical protein BN1723_018960, partial [Verticillium longisporum]
TLHVKQYEGAPKPPSTATDPVTHIDIDQTATGGVKGTKENRCLDLEFREHADWLFGSCRGQSDWRSPAEIEDEFLKKGWLEGDAESTGPQGKSHVYSHVENVDNGWTATQIWGFQEIDGQRRYARNLVVAKDDKKVEFRLVYDYLVATPSTNRLFSSVTTAVSHPADVMVSKLNANRAPGEAFGGALSRIYKDIGFSGLWNGLPVRIVMIGTLTGLQWMIYDYFKIFMGLPTTGGASQAVEKK